MRVLALIPDLIRNPPWKQGVEYVLQNRLIAAIPLVRRLSVHPWLYTDVAWGGALNIMRHAQVARDGGAEVFLTTPTGTDTYGEFGVTGLPWIAWRHRRPDDLVLIPEFCSELADRCRGPVIVYLQGPAHVRRNFEYLSQRITLWTNSPFTLARCREAFPGKDLPMVPNIVDNRTFKFIPQSERETGLAIAFPRKGPEFIERTISAYRARAGAYWKFELIEGVTQREVAARMRRPQAFIASADLEGCAMPPQECMASGIVVVGKNANGANFYMEHGSTALVANTPEQAAQGLIELENAALREAISRRAYEYISRWFPDREPAALWRSTLTRLGFDLNGPRSRPTMEGLGIPT